VGCEITGYSGKNAHVISVVVGIDFCHAILGVEVCVDVGTVGESSLVDLYLYL
jgi:hypothetical protein